MTRQGLGSLFVVALLSCAPAAAPHSSSKEDGLWVSAPDLSDPRFGHTATKLQDGRVLITGGLNGSSTSSLDGAELYDPASNTWASAASMSVARHNHAAVLLNDGRVMIAGGSRLNNGVTVFLNTTEYYNPSADTWSSGPTMSVARDLLTATVNPFGGNVYLVGGRVSGYCGGGPCDVSTGLVEVVDPSGWLWQEGSISPSRYGHSALAVEEYLYVIGGSHKSSSSPVSLDSVWSFEMATAGPWVQVASMNQARAWAGAVMAPGLGFFGGILVTGGRATNGSITNTSEVYDFWANTWSMTGSMATARSPAFLATLPSGRILAVGTTGSAETYDPQLGTWQTKSSTLGTFAPTSATALSNGSVLLAGGLGPNSAIASTSQIYWDRRWQSDTSTFPWVQGDSAFQLLDGRILRVGGYEDVWTWFATARIYEPQTNTWTTTTPMSVARGDFGGAVLADGRVFVAGGINASAWTGEIYNPSTATWTPTSSAPGSLGNDFWPLVAPISANKVLVCFAGSPSPCAIYHIPSNTWTITGSTNINWGSYPQFVIRTSGEVVLFGPYQAVEIFDPTTETWGQLNPTVWDHGYFFRVKPLPNGKIVVTGGVVGSVPVSAVELYDVTGGGSAQIAGGLVFPRYGFGLVQYGDSILAVGGICGNPANWCASTESYDVLSGTWRPEESMLYERVVPHVFPLSRTSVMAIGGGAIQQGALPNELLK